MNERIRDLIVQSTELKEIKHEGYCTGKPYYTYEDYFNTEKFAESIVKECIERITTYDLVPGHSAKWEDIYEIHARLLQDLGKDLKEHFGVQE